MSSRCYRGIVVSSTDINMQNGREQQNHAHRQPGHRHVPSFLPGLSRIGAIDYPTPLRQCLYRMVFARSSCAVPFTGNGWLGLWFAGSFG